MLPSIFISGAMANNLPSSVDGLNIKVTAEQWRSMATVLSQKNVGGGDNACTRAVMLALER